MMRLLGVTDMSQHHQHQPQRPQQYFYQQGQQASGQPQFLPYGSAPYQAPLAPQVQVVLPRLVQANPPIPSRPQTQPQFPYPPQYPSQYPPQYPSQYEPQYQPQYSFQYPPRYPPTFHTPPHIQPAAPSPVAPAQPPQRVLQDVEPNTSRQQRQAKSVPQPDHLPPPEEPDYGLLLLTLADDYFEAATKLPSRSDEYYKLVATALGCLESTLNNFKLAPLREAQVSLRYAQVLYDETENYDDAERVLTKGIDLCERNKFMDLKYAMQLLLSRVLYQSKPKAALKDIQAMIEDIEAYRHIAWAYAFRFQQAMFSRSSSSSHDSHSATLHLEKLASLARQQGDNAVLAFAHTMEALLYLRGASPDAVDAAQRSLAKARALQLNADVEGNPQMMLLMEFIDLCCSLRESNIPQSDQKRKIMQKVLYQSLESSHWRDDGILQIPIAKRSLANLPVQENGLISERNGKFFLTFSWMTKEDAETLAFLVSAVTVAHKNAYDGGKAEKLIESGLEYVRAPSSKLMTTMPDTTGAASYRKALETHFLLEAAFLQCSRGQWLSARKTLEAVDQVLMEMGEDSPVEMEDCVLYLKGVVQQGSGDLSAALTTFQSPVFDLASFSSRPRDAESETTRDIRLLAAMNTAMIIHQSSHPQHSQLESLLSKIESQIQTSHNKHVQASYSLLLSVLPNNAILKTKQFLGNALSAAKAIGNTQITALTLILMQERFFKGVVGEQAIKCAKAASAQVKKWGDSMWDHVAARMEAECFEVQGMKEAAQQKKDEAQASISGLPENIRNRVT